ncbi:MAG: hypothetical protein WC091_26230, partial [Sulfuricellaceae bacterium]
FVLSTEKTDSPQRTRRTQRKSMRVFLCVLRVLCGEKGFVFMGCRHESSSVEQRCAKIAWNSWMFSIIDFHHEFLRTNLPCSSAQILLAHIGFRVAAKAASALPDEMPQPANTPYAGEAHVWFGGR